MDTPPTSKNRIKQVYQLMVQIYLLIKIFVNIFPNVIDVVVRGSVLCVAFLPQVPEHHPAGVPGHLPHALHQLVLPQG